MSNELNPAAEYLYPAEEESTVQTQDQQQNVAQESQKESNMRILRERAEAAERRMAELENMVKMNMSQQQTTKMQVVDNDEDDFDLSDDTYIEGKHLKKYVRSLKNELKNTKKQFEDFNQQQALSHAEMRLKNQFSDFETVVNKANIEKFAQQNPVLYRTILANTDIYDKGYAAYELIKHSGIITDQYDALEKKVEENRFKPRSAANVSPQSGETPLTRVGDYDRRILTEERKDQLRRQVELAKSYKQ